MSSYRLREQLKRYELRSVDPDDVGIDARTLVPTLDGGDLSFGLATGISASDAIRTKWPYHAALFETSAG